MVPFRPISNFDVGEGQSTPRFSSTDSGFFDASGETVLTPVLNSGTADDFQQETGEGSKSLTSHLSNESTDNSPIFTLPGKAKKRKRVADEDDIIQLVGAIKNVTEPILAKNADPDEMFLLSFSAALKSLSTKKMGIQKDGR